MAKFVHFILRKSPLFSHPLLITPSSLWASETPHRRSADRPGPQQQSWWKGSGILQTTSTERRAAGGDRPRSGGSVKMPGRHFFKLDTRRQNA